MIASGSYSIKTLEELSYGELEYITCAATEGGLVRHILSLYDTDRIGATLPVIICYRSTVHSIATLAAWGILRGYLSVYVDPAYRRQGIGGSIVALFVREHGSDLMFATKDPGAIKMFRKHLTRGPA